MVYYYWKKLFQFNLSRSLYSIQSDKMNSVGSKRKRSAYDAAFKLNVIEYVEANNNCAAACKFCVKEKQVQEWQKSKATWEEMPRIKKACQIETAFYPELEKELSDLEYNKALG